MIIPRLQAFYGGDPGGWWHLPVGLLRAYDRMLSPIEAQRKLDQATAIALGTGSMEKRDHDRVMWQLNRAVRRHEEKPRKKTKEQIAAELAEMGIALREA